MTLPSARPDCSGDSCSLHSCRCDFSTLGTLGQYSFQRKALGACGTVWVLSGQGQSSPGLESSCSGLVAVCSCGRASMPLAQGRTCPRWWKGHWFTPQLSADLPAAQFANSSPNWCFWVEMLVVHDTGRSLLLFKAAKSGSLPSPSWWKQLGVVLCCTRRNCCFYR